MTRKLPLQIIHLTSIATLLFGAIPAFSQDKAPASPIPVLKTEVRLVVLDVLVTDSHGKAIPNLKAEDFSLTESGTPQTIKTLEDHTAAPTGASAGTISPAVIEKPLAAGTYSNRPRLQSNIWNVILVDLLNTPAQNQIIARKALKEFASRLPTGAPVALLAMSSSSVKMLVPFTPNGTEISKLLDGDALLSTQSPLLDTYNADDEAQLEKALGAAKNRVADSYRETEMDRLQVRVEQTLQSLDGVAAWLGRLPGRKNLYWLSAGFPLSAEPQTMRNGVNDRASERWLQSYALLQHETDTRL
jgi:VWFA-related protein